MITKLEVRGFKNLKNVSVFFGPFTCIAGHNGVGKSNLFDALKFLSATASMTLDEAAAIVRDDQHKSVNPEDLFYRHGNEHSESLYFSAEMIVPQTGSDDLGQSAKASATFLRYELKVGKTGKGFGEPKLRVEREELTYIPKGDLKKHLHFKFSDSWISTAITGKKSSQFISTKDDGSRIVLHQDRLESSGGRPQELAGHPFRTILSTTRSSEAKTAVVACNELRSWRQLQFEPSSLRTPDNFLVRPKLGDRGEHLPATIYRLLRQHRDKITGEDNKDDQSAILAELSLRLAQLIDESYELDINVDNGRELLTLVATDRFGTRLQARDLSDGTLRFLALCTLLLDTEGAGLICLEEPENGINPSRVPAIVSLLQEISSDVNEKVGIDNPLRQVIINTHSQEVVANVPDDSLLYAENLRGALSLAHLSRTWRANAVGGREISSGQIVSYLLGDKKVKSIGPKETGVTRVAERKEIQLGLFGGISK
jgi:predicted ATPase